MADASIHVTIEGENFSLDTIPKADTQLVVSAKDELLGEVDLAALVDDLGKLGFFIRLAYNGVAGNTELEIKVQQIGRKITELADESAVTVHSFKGASRQVLRKLQGTYQYLLDGLEDMALVTLSQLSKVAEKMANAAEKLHGEFKKAKQEVTGTWEEAKRAKGDEVKRKDEMAKEHETLETQMKQMEIHLALAKEAEENAARLFADAQKREDKAYKSQTSLLKKVTDAIGKILEAGTAGVTLQFNRAGEILQSIGDQTVYKEAIKRANEEKMKYLEAEQKQRDIRREGDQQMMEFAKRIKNCKDDGELAQVAIDALHGSVGALNSLTNIMMKAASFWRLMQTHCEALAEENMKAEIEEAKKMPKEDRMKTWTSKAFKTSAIEYYSKWVALDDVCGKYMVQIKETRADLYAYLEENPTIEQSRVKVRKLAVEFEELLESAEKNTAARAKKKQPIE